MNTMNEKANAAVDNLVATLRTQGQVWARFGLQAGRLALETNARALSHLAESLGKLSETLDAKVSDAPEVPIASAEVTDAPEAPVASAEVTDDTTKS